MTVPVLIAGAGPVGLALAIELGRLGVRCLLVEKRDGTVSVPKMSQVSARNMEFCRRWGIAERVRTAVWPESHALDFVYMASLTGPELARLKVPSYAARGRLDFTPEGPCHCPQIYFDPILADHARKYPGVELRYDTALESFRQDANGVTAVLRDMNTDRTEEVRAHYLVGCDGPGGVVREALGIGLGGRGVVAHSINIFFRSPELASLHDKGWARFYRPIDATGCWSEMIAIDGRALWRLTVFDDPAPGFDAEAALTRVVGRPFPHEIISVQHWERRDYVANSYGAARVFIAGDAAHQCSPTGGLGMHTGVEEAMNLAWKLDAVERGWGGPKLLASYQAERRPIALRNVTLATRAFDTIAAIPGIGAAAAALAGRRDAAALAHVRGQINTFSVGDGLKLQYAYEGSPVCVADGSPPPPDSERFVPSARPGTRAPHAWLADGRSMLDLFGDGFALLRLGARAPDAAALRDAARARGVPVTEVAITDPAIAEMYGAALVLVRPDGHVAWRGDACPPDAAAVVDQVRGAA